MQHHIEAIVAAIEEQVYERVMRELSNSQPTNKWLSMQEAADYLGVSVELVQRLCAQKVLPHVSFGVPGSRRPRILISLNALNEWLRVRERESVANRKETHTG